MHEQTVKANEIYLIWCTFKWNTCVALWPVQAVASNRGRINTFVETFRKHVQLLAQPHNDTHKVISAFNNAEKINNRPRVLTNS